MRHVGVPVTYFMVSLAFAATVTVLTYDIMAFFLVLLVLVWLGRKAWGGDHNRPRVLWLAFVSGAFSARVVAERRAWGGQTYDPLGVRFRAR
jgi:type IV secretory pathway VirB3-like protein